MSKNKYGMNKVNQNQVITDITQWQSYIIVTQNDTFSDLTLAVHSKRYRICNKMQNLSMAQKYTVKCHLIKLILS